MNTLETNENIESLSKEIQKKEEPNGNLYNNQDKIQWMGSTAEPREQRKESRNLKTEQLKLLSLNNKEKTDKNEHSLRDLRSCKKRSNTCVTRISEEARKRAEMKNY